MAKINKKKKPVTKYIINLRLEQASATYETQAHNSRKQRIVRHYTPRRETSMSGMETLPSSP
jgi:hypothetical protein